MNSKKRIIGILSLALLIFACSPALYKPTMADATHSGVSTENLKEGRSLYTDHCGSCHALHLPGEFTRSRWEKVMPMMQRKAKITDQQAKLITSFVLARCKPE